ncbi:MAG: NDP-sugar synthase [Succinivibrio sp.]
MRAMILAAGRGERLRPITDTIPKPMVEVAGHPLLWWHVMKLRQAGITKIIVNSAWLHEKIEQYLGDGSRFGVRIAHSVEGPGGLETAGGIVKALPFFEGRPFLVVNGDTLMDADYRQFLNEIPGSGQARIFLTENPPHHPQGDFCVRGGKAAPGGSGALTFTGAALYTPAVFDGMEPVRMPLRPVFDRLARSGCLLASQLCGRWFDCGTVERLRAASEYMETQGAKA